MKVKITLEYTTTVQVVQEVPEDTNSLDLETYIHEKGFDWVTIDEHGSTETHVGVGDADPDEKVTSKTWEDFVL